MKLNKLILNDTSVYVHWTHLGNSHESMWYCHSDNSWHPDPDTRKLDPKTLRRLNCLVIKALCRKEKKRSRRRVNDVWFAEDVRERYGL